MINRQWTGIFGLPHRSSCPQGGSGARTPRRRVLPNMSGLLRSLPDRGTAFAVPGGNQINPLICSQDTTPSPVNLHQSWNFL